MVDQTEQFSPSKTFLLCCYAHIIHHLRQELYILKWIGFCSQYKIFLKFFFFFFFPEVEGKGKHNSHAFSVFWLTCGNNIAHWGAYISFFSLYKIDGLIQN